MRIIKEFKDSFNNKFRIIKQNEANVVNGRISICKTCDEEFTPVTNSQKYCGCCEIQIQCTDCNEWFKIRSSNINKINKEYRCRKCLNRKTAKENQKPGNCTKCGKFNEHRTVVGLGIECGCSKSHNIEASKIAFKKNTDSGKCTRCGKLNIKRSMTGFGYECGCAIKYNKEHVENNKKPGKCSHCGKFNEHRTVAGLGIECGCSTKHNMNNLKKINKKIMKIDDIEFSKSDYNVV